MKKQCVILSLLVSSCLHNAQGMTSAPIGYHMKNRQLTLQELSQLFVIKHMIDNPTYKDSYLKENSIKEHKDLVYVANFIECAARLSHDPDYDINFLKTALSPHALADLNRTLDVCPAFDWGNGNKNINEQKRLITCIHDSLQEIRTSKQLLRLLLIALTMPSFQAYFIDNQVSSQALTDQLLQYLVAQDDLTTLYYAVSGNDWLSVMITKRLTDIYLEKIESFSDLIDYYHPDFLDVRQTSAYNNARLQEKKDLFFEQIKQFYDVVADNNQTADKIIAYLLATGLFNADSMRLLDLIFSKGFTPQVMIDGLSAFNYLFDKNYEKLFSTDQQIRAIMPFILFLVENGLDIQGSLSEKDAVSKTNLETIIQNYPQYKNQLEKAQDTFQEKKTKSITNRNS